MPLKASDDVDLRDRLQNGLEQLGLSFDDHQVSQLLRYIALLEQWNVAYNLTAVKDPQEMIDLHILDSLAVAKYLHAESILDVGSGAGLPGIPLAIMLPTKFFTLIDSNGKKTRFLFHARSTLGLRNCIEVHQRVEEYSCSQRFDIVISRAFSGLAAMVKSCQHLLRDNGLFFAMKGKLPVDELDQLPSGYDVLQIEKLLVPGLLADRHLLQIAPSKQ